MSTHHFCYCKLGQEALCASLPLDMKVQEKSLVLQKKKKPNESARGTDFQIFFLWLIFITLPGDR